MAWNNQSGGGPWGSGSGGGRGRTPPPDFEDLFRKGQDNLRRIIPNGNKPSRIIGLIVLVVVGLWLATGFYQVQEGQQGAVLRFGKWVKTTHAGINYHLPYPIETVMIQRVDQINVIDSGVSVKSSSAFNDEDSSNFMLTGDENIVSVNFTIQWYIKDIGQYLFRISEPDLTVKQAAESAVREIVSQTQLEYALTKGRGEIADKAQVLLQRMLDHYESGIQIVRVQLKSIDPPPQAIDAFRDVQRARADRESKINEANAYRNSVVPVAKGEASKIIQAAEAYRKAIVDEAIGRTARFLAVLEQYQLAPEVTRKRLFLETMQTILQGSHKVIIDGKSGQHGVLPYLPLKTLQPRGEVTGTASASAKETTPNEPK
jgi:membrane protease subunit HflK